MTSRTYTTQKSKEVYHETMNIFMKKWNHVNENNPNNGYGLKRSNEMQ
jgi:hypothetical protein